MSHPYYPTGNPRFNHVAMSLPAGGLDADHRADLCRFWGEVFGFDELEMLTEDRHRLVFSCVHWDQFMFLIAEDEPMTCPRLDHFGFAVGSEEELRGRARPGRGLPREGRPGRPHRPPCRRPGGGEDPLLLRALPAAHDVRGAVVGVRPMSAAAAEAPASAPTGSRSGSSSPRAGSSSTRGGAVPTPGTEAWSWPSWPSRSATTTSGSTTTSRPCPGDEPTHVFEAFTMLAALSQRTSRIGLGQLVTCSSYRNAGLAGQGGGLHRRLLRRPAHPRAGRGMVFARSTSPTATSTARTPSAWPSSTRPSRWSAGCGPRSRSPSTGDHLHFDGAYCDPKPVQQLPPILVGGGGEQVNLRIAARRADLTNWQVGIEAFERKSAVLARHCEEVGRPFDEIVRTHGPDCRIFDTERDTVAWCESEGGGSLWGGTATDAVPGRQPGGHGRPGDREDPGLPRRRMPRPHPLAARLPGRRDAAPVHGPRSCPSCRCT